MASIMTVRAPDDLQSKLKKRASKQGYTRNGLILKILWDWINEQDKQDKAD